MRWAATVEASERLRLFVALRLPDETLSRLREWQDGGHLSRPGVRPVGPGNAHITLAFLGNRAASDVEPVLGALHAAAAAGRRAVLTVTGYRETRSVGMLVLDDAGGAATALALDLHERLERLGVYRCEARPWLPHLTVARFRERPRLRPPLPDLGEISPSEAAVYHSVLRRSGAQYEVLESVALGG